MESHGRITLSLRRRLAAHEYPLEFEFIDDFPVTVTGKIKRRDLRKREIQRLGLATKGR